MDGMLSLYWNNHKATFCHILATLREKERYTDATLACEGKFYPVHKLVLSTCSEYFELMFDNTPCKHPIIVLKDVKPDELEALLSYMYAGVVSVAQNDLARLIKAAELLQIKGLAVPDEPPATEDNKRNLSSRDGRDQRGSPQSKRRRREENGSLSQGGSLPSNSPPTSPRSSPYPHESEYRAHHRAMSENQRTELRRESNDPSTSQDSSESDVKVMVDETLVKEEAIETIDEEHSGGLEFIPVGTESGIDNQGGDDHMLPNKYDQPGGIPGQTQPLADAVAEALAGPSGMQGWLGVGDMPGGFSSENFGGDGSQDMHGSPGGPQAQQRMALSEDVVTATGEREFIYVEPDIHQDITRKIHQCPHCPVTANTPSRLSEHVRTHTGEKPFACPHCPYSSARERNLKNHMITHTGEKPFHCPFCETRCSRKQDLQKHIRTHTGEKPFGCTVCSYTTSQKGNLKNHMVTHTGEKPYICPHCSVGFSTKPEVQRHIRVHTGEKPFACPACSYKSAQLSGLNSHIAHNHKHN